MAPKMVMGVRLPSEPPRVTVDSETRSDKATLELIRGRGFVLTFTSHFAVAVIVGVAGWLYAEHKSGGGVPDDVLRDIKELKAEMVALRSDFEFAKATQKMSDSNTESKLNELLARTSK